MRAANMQVLTDELKARHPGVVVYGIGDAAHKLETSDHNEDDTPGSKSEQTDADNVPEHRAIDVMLGPSFSKDDAEHLVRDLVIDHPENKPRLHYVIWNGVIWSESHNFEERPYDGSNPHKDHVHVSGKASDDENTTSWHLGAPATPTPTLPPSTPRNLELGMKGDDVHQLQQSFKTIFPIYRGYVSVKRGQMIAVDGDFGPQTRAWVIEFQRRVGILRDGIVGPVTRGKLRQYGFKG